MSPEISKIIQSNRDTFYDFSSGVRANLLWLRLAKLVVATASAVLFSVFSDPFLAAVLTVYSILIGFSFNVLFQLFSFDPSSLVKGDASLERRVRVDRLKTLGDELFYNISYFNIVSIAVVVLALGYSFVYAPVPFLRRFVHVGLFSTALADARMYLELLKEPLRFLGCSIFYYLLIESICTLGRTIARMSFFFSLKIRLQNEA